MCQAQAQWAKESEWEAREAAARARANAEDRASARERELAREREDALREVASLLASLQAAEDALAQQALRARKEADEAQVGINSPYSKFSFFSFFC